MDKTMDCSKIVLKCLIALTVSCYFVGCDRSKDQSAEWGSQPGAAHGGQVSPKFMVTKVVNGATVTGHFNQANPNVIRNQFAILSWDPGTELAVQTKSDVIRISQSESGELIAKWAQDFGNDRFRFRTCDLISQDQALELLLSLSANDGKHAKMVEWKEDQ